MRSRRRPNRPGDPALLPAAGEQSGGQRSATGRMAVACSHGRRPAHIVRLDDWSGTEELCRMARIRAGMPPLPAIYSSLRKQSLPGSRDWRALRRNGRAGYSAAIRVMPACGAVRRVRRAMGKRGAGIGLELRSIWRPGEAEKTCGDKDFATRARTGYAAGFAFIRLPGQHQITLERTRNHSVLFK